MESPSKYDQAQYWNKAGGKKLSRERIHRNSDNERPEGKRITRRLHEVSTTEIKIIIFNSTRDRKRYNHDISTTIARIDPMLRVVDSEEEHE